MLRFTKFFLAGCIVGSAGAAHAGLEICNETDFVQSVSIGYKGDADWVSEGWWNVEPGDCTTVVGGNLQKRYYYYRAEVDGGDFAGENYMFCTTPEEYEILGDSNCESRGYDSESFREIDTGETATDFTYTLVNEDGSPRSSGGPANTTADGEDGLNICNETEEIQSVSIGYQNDDGFVSEGWWNIEPGACAKVLSGELQQRFYYYRAEVDAGPFEGEGYMFCTTPEVYSIQGDTDCEARGYDSESFSEIDTGPTARTYTHYINADGASAPPVETVTSTDIIDDAGAGLEICNDTDFIQAVTVGYQGADDWTSEGWWNIDPGDCAMPTLDGVNRRYFYYRAEVDGGPFEGESYYFCTSPEAFTIAGDAECEARGYVREDYREIDTGGETGIYTLTLVTSDVPDMPPSVDGDGDGDGDVLDSPFAEDTASEPDDPSFDFGLPGDGNGEESEVESESSNNAELVDEAEPVVGPETKPESEVLAPPESENVVEEPENAEEKSSPAPTRRGGSRGG
ncbi:DUF1036 domain-containing protein [Pseudoruegeria sp. HB172150]|uniref:DUF1036 domain-containing protein n=1 Tax=Pseudoruegeria sp. HB172150 TaxID=2721164 RepID=UPI00155490E9|nr:DUF1036 domain-containing protein [Pseudoruegeria sp. HB172150]